MKLSEITERWGEIVKLAKSKSLLSGAILAASRPRSLHGDTLDILIGQGLTLFHVKHLDPELVRWSLHKVTGEAFALKVTLLPLPEESPAVSHGATLLRGLRSVGGEGRGRQTREG